MLTKYSEKRLASARLVDAVIVVTDSIRELEGAVIRVVTLASLTGDTVSLALAEDVLANMYGTGS